MASQDGAMTPRFTVQANDGSQTDCTGEYPPYALAMRQSLVFRIDGPSFGVFPNCAITNVYETHGQIDTIVVRTSQAPFDGYPAESGSSPDPGGIGAKFLAYARGETDWLPVGSSVRLYLGNSYQKTIDASDIEQRATWDICAAYAERSCPMSAVQTLRDFSGRFSMRDWLPPGGCLSTIAAPPTDAVGNPIVVLGASGISSCGEDFGVQIWSNDLGQITAVNLLLGAP